MSLSVIRSFHRYRIACTMVVMSLSLAGSPAFAAPTPEAVAIPPSASIDPTVARLAPASSRIPRIAYVAASDQGQDIFTTFPDGARLRRVTYSGDAGSPAWSPDGTRLAYVENGDIWATGRHDPIQLTFGESIDRYPAWSPDGDRLSFTRAHENGDSVLVVLHLATGALDSITEPTALWPRVGPATWAPGGRRIAFVRESSQGDDYDTYRALHLIDIDGSHLARLPEAGNFVWDPSWSPDGDRILYTNDYHGRGGECDAQVMSIRLDGSAPSRVFSQGCESHAGSWSPTGASVVVEADSPLFGDGRLAGVWTLRLDGTRPRLVALAGSDPVWQPVARALHTPGGRADSTSRVSGPRLAYTASSTLGWDIFTIRPDGSRRRQLTHTGDSLHPTWSPDHSRIAFTRDNAVWVMDARGDHLRRVTDTYGAAPTWSPDGRRIAWADYSALKVANVRSGRVRALPLPHALAARRPAWSPNGRWLAFAARRHFGLRSDMYAVRPDGSGLHRITRTRGAEAEPEWSPSGRRIAFSYTTTPSDGVRGSDVFSVRPDGLARQIVRETAGADYSPAWSPDGRRLVVYSEGPAPYGDDPRPGLWVLRPDGGRPHLVAEKREILEVDW